ncbi:MAG: tRNA adenosine(34) deaminase TadA [Planctomycetota bacterium]
MTIDQDAFFMQAALAEAQTAAQEGEVPVGAVITTGGRILGRGRNACERLQDATAHAEMLAITAASETLGSWRLEDCTLYVTLEPCPMCMGAALNSRIGRIVYAAPEPKAGACGSVVDLAAPPGFNHRISVTAGLGEPEAAALMQAFFKQLRDERRRRRLHADGSR